jgi:hypothetical protein
MPSGRDKRFKVEGGIKNRWKVEGIRLKGRSKDEHRTLNIEHRIKTVLDDFYSARE